MKIYSVYDPEFKEYGEIVPLKNVDEFLAALSKTPLPESGTIYAPSDPQLENTAFGEAMKAYYGYMPIQIGYCNGRNTKLNCLEYHRDSEVNIGVDPFILILAKRADIEDGQLDSEKAKAFAVPAGVAVEVFATAMHYAPAETDPNAPFRVAVVLPKGTNADLEESKKEGLLWAVNKWLLAHPQSNEAKAGAKVCSRGENIDLSK